MDRRSQLQEMLGAFFDAESKRIDEVIRTSKARYRIVMEAATEAIITIDEESRIVFINQAAEKLFGYSVAEMIGQPLMMLMPEALRSAHLSPLPPCDPSTPGGVSVHPHDGAGGDGWLAAPSLWSELDESIWGAPRAVYRVATAACGNRGETSCADPVKPEIAANLADAGDSRSPHGAL